MFPAKSDEVTGPTLVLLPTEPLSCLAVSVAVVYLGTWSYAVPES